MLKYTNIDIDTCTKEELEIEITRLEQEMWDSFNLQLALKILLNSSYGVIGSQYFICYDKDIAEAITLQGQNIIIFSAKIIEKYFKTYWPEDYEVHEALGVKPIKPITGNLIIAGDTDSITSTAKIITENYTDTIENLFEKEIVNSKLIEFNDVQQSIMPKDLKILNYNDAEMEFTKVKYVYRHKVSKAKWKLKTELGKEIIVTNDHSMVVFREDNEKITIKPFDILVGDKVLTVDEYDKFNYIFEEIESCECIGEFEDEWVYDIEVDDETHTFIANDILVHNSCYVSVQEVIEKTEGITDPLQFILDLYESRIKDYFYDVFNLYAKKWNANSLQEFELESIAEKAFWIAKKKYALELRWKEGGSSVYKGKQYPGQFFELGTSRKYTGVEIKKKSTPLFARTIIDKVMNILFLEGNNLNMNNFIKVLRKYKEDFKLQDINNISMLSTVNNYSKFILSDRTTLKVAPKCPVHVRAGGTYNLTLNINPKYKNKYEFINSGNKIKYYYVKGTDGKGVFGFPVGRYPIEIAPEIDYDIMFSKTVLSAVNRFIKVMKKPLIPNSLITTKRLF